MSDDGALVPEDPAEEASDDEPSSRVGVRAWVTGRAAKATVTISILGIVAVGMLYLSYQLAGIIATIAYAIAFVFGATLIPFTVLFFAPSFPGFMRSFMGKIHWVLGSVAFETVYLVQQDEQFDLCPGTRESVYIDGEWREIVGGQENLQILGWKPFGIIFDKDRSSIGERIEEGAVADGGMATRIDNTTIKEPAVDDGEFAVDLRRVFSSGVRQMGAIAIIEKAEEVIKRQESSDSRVGGWEPIIATALGLIIGAGMGYLALGGT